MASGHAFTGGLSYPGLLCCLVMSLRYAVLLSLWLSKTQCWNKGFVDFLPVLRPPACSGSASPGGFSSPLWFTPFVMGSPLRGRGLFVLDWNEGLVTIWVRCLGLFNGLRTSV